MAGERLSFSDKGARSQEIRAVAAAAGYTVLETIAGEDIFCDPTLSHFPEKSQLLKSSMPKIGGADLILVHTLTCTTAEIAPLFPYPKKIVGFGYIGPFANADTIELSAGPETDKSALNAAAELFNKLGKRPEAVSDAVGLVGPRVLCCLINEAFSALESRICGETELELAMRLGTNYPKGLIEWGRMIGFKQILTVLEALSQVYGDAYRPNPLLKRYALDKNI